MLEAEVWGSDVSDDALSAWPRRGEVNGIQGNSLTSLYFEGCEGNSESEDVREECGTNSQTTVIVSLQRDEQQNTLHPVTLTTLSLLQIVSAVTRMTYLPAPTGI